MLFANADDVIDGMMIVIFGIPALIIVGAGWYSAIQAFSEKTEKVIETPETLLNKKKEKLIKLIRKQGIRNGDMVLVELENKDGILGCFHDHYPNPDILVEFKNRDFNEKNFSEVLILPMGAISFPKINVNDIKAFPIDRIKSIRKIA